MTMLTQWHTQFPNCEPAAHLLRVAFPDRWVRFHSLPESKRYPDNEAEYAEVLRRHNTILGALVESRPKAVLLTTGYTETPEPVRDKPELWELDPEARPWRSLPMHEVEHDYNYPNFWHIYSSVWDWRPGLLDPIVRLVADDIVANVLVVSDDCQWVLHPYDGGMDVIAESPIAMKRLKLSHRDWLSSREDGL